MNRRASHRKHLKSLRRSRVRAYRGGWAVVTGAARDVGLGYAFARQLAAEGVNLIIVDVLDEELTARAAELRADFGVEVRAVPGLGAWFLLDGGAQLGNRGVLHQIRVMLIAPLAAMFGDDPELIQRHPAFLQPRDAALKLIDAMGDGDHGFGVAG